jgi:UDP-N-acetylglucosamine 2-epimerase (non-hydrolysing)
MKKRKCEVVAIYGTSAELIKMWPVIQELGRYTRVTTLTTNQQPQELRELERRLDVLAPVHLRSSSRGNLVHKRQVIPWLIGVSIRTMVQLIRLKAGAKRRGKGVLVLVHGDTMTCVVGAAAARLTLCQVGHVEAGLRSKDWRNPFPEELDRVITSYLAHFHFCPDEIAVTNLTGRSGRIVNTFGNTSRDSMRIIQNGLSLRANHVPFALVSLHRAELLGSPEHLQMTVKELIDCGSRVRIVMVLDALTTSSLADHGLLNQLRQSDIELRDKMPYPDFLELVTTAARVVTDSGGLQEECGFLGIPCLVHRRATERFDGIGTTASLSMWNPGSITDFLSQDLLPVSGTRRLEASHSPTEVIARALLDDGIL